MEKTKLYILPLGYIENDLALNLALHNQATIDEKNKRAEWTRVSSIALLISHPKLGWVLIDTGSHRDAMVDRWPEANRKLTPLIRTEEDMLESRLAEVGLKPSDIDLLILTHMHLDHAGSLDTFKNTKAGKKVYVHELELKQALFDVFKENKFECVNGYIKSDFVDIPGIAFYPVYGDVKLAKDLELIWLPGHTPGLFGFMITLADSGTIIYTSDAINSSKNYGPPIRISGVVYNAVDMAKSIERVRNLEMLYDAKLIFGHDLENFNTLKKTPDFYS